MTAVPDNGLAEPTANATAKIVYLDQNKWIDLARAVKAPDDFPEHYAVLEKLVEGSKAGELLVPLTQSNIYETHKISVEKMRAHCTMLDSHSDNLTKAAAARIAVQGRTGKDVLKEVATAAETCQSTIDFFGDDDPIPWSVLESVKRTQQSIANATNAIVLMMALGLDLGS